MPVIPDREAAVRARAAVRDVYEAKGSGAGMAAFIAMSSWNGEYTDDYFAQPLPDPAMFGIATKDDGARGDPLLSDRSWAISDYRLSHHGGFVGGEHGYGGQPEAFARTLRAVLDS